MRNLIHLIETASHEADEAEAWESISRFANQLSERDGPYNESYPEDNQPFPQLFMGGYAEDGFTRETALQIIQPLVAEMRDKGWFLAKQFETQYDDGDDDSPPQTMVYFGFLPNRGRKEMVPQRVFHLSPRANRAMIERDGIKANRGGSDFIHTEVGRVYVILDDVHIDDIEKDIKKHRGAHDPKWLELDVWSIYAWDMPDEWHVDLELDGVAAWTTHDIPVDLISLES